MHAIKSLLAQKIFMNAPAYGTKLFEAMKKVQAPGEPSLHHQHRTITALSLITAGAGVAIATTADGNAVGNCMQHGRIISLQDYTITGSPAQVLPFTIYSLQQDANGALAPGSKRRIGTWIETTGLSIDHQPIYPGWVPATATTQYKVCLLYTSPSPRD